MDHAVGVALIPDDVAGLIEILAAELEVVRAAGEVVLEVAERARVLIAAPLVQPMTAAAADFVRDQIFIARRFGIAVETEVVAELAGAEFRERILSECAVPFRLVDPAR